MHRAKNIDGGSAVIPGRFVLVIRRQRKFQPGIRRAARRELVRTERVTQTRNIVRSTGISPALSGDSGASSSNRARFRRAFGEIAGISLLNFNWSRNYRYRLDTGQIKPDMSEKMSPIIRNALVDTIIRLE